MPAMKRGEMDVPMIQQRHRVFAAEREWEQFHTPKNLAMALSVEAAVARTLPVAESGGVRVPRWQRIDLIGKELADVLIYSLRLADVVGVDVGAPVDDTEGTRQQKDRSEDRPFAVHPTWGPLT